MATTTTTIRSPADAVNAALVQIGWKSQIGDVLDGSVASQLALAVYGQIRDAVLRSHAYDFSQRTVVLTLLKQAPANGYVPGVSPWDPATNPPLPWQFEMAYPSDCIKVRAIKPTPIFAGPNYAPSPNVFTIANDNAFSPAREVILCNLPNAVCIYTAQVTDLTTWSEDAKQVFIDQLAEALAAALNPQAAQVAAAKEQQADQMATTTQG